jgi:alkylation response protein AidB-like acyl-CoA dehydrogenase
MTVFRNRNAGDASNVLYRAGKIVRYDKAAPSPEMEHIDWGLGIFSPEAFAGAGPDPLDLAAVQSALAAAGRLAAYEASEPFHEIGSAAGLEALRAAMPRLASDAVIGTKG